MPFFKLIFQGNGDDFFGDVIEFEVEKESEGDDDRSDFFDEISGDET